MLSLILTFRYIRSSQKQAASRQLVFFFFDTRLPCPCMNRVFLPVDKTARNVFASMGSEVDYSNLVRNLL